MNLIQLIYNKSIKDIFTYFKEKKEKASTLAKRDIIISNYLKNNTIKKLQIGCGPFPMDGWLNTDIIHNENIAYMDAGERFPLNDNSIDVIYTEHVFEHLTFTQGLNMLKESYRVLKKGGRIRIATPDLFFLIKLTSEKTPVNKEYVNHSIRNHWNLKPVKETFQESEFSEVFVINNFFKDWGHQIIHNFDSLELMLKKAGFENIVKETVGHSSEITLNNIEQHGQQIGDNFNLLETLVVEAKK